MAQLDERQSGGDRPFLPASRSFIVAFDLWERFCGAIEALRQVDDPALPSEAQEAIVQSAEGTLDNIRTVVPVSGEQDPWRFRSPEADCCVSVIKAAGELGVMLELLLKDYGGLTDPGRRPEAFPCLKPLTKQAIDNLVGSTNDLVRYFAEFGGVPVEITDKKPSGGKAEAAPVEYLMNWREILDELKQKNDEEKRTRIRRLNDMHDGPIIFPGQGAQPTVDKAKLLPWWNGLEDRLRELEQQQADRQATVADQVNYGKDGTVVPGIAGGVKKRRKDRKS
ncbi:MAG: hypothetical protein ABSG53_22045 [Thermoguttaceae bacterium]|jgi:hypothetical protein